MANTVKSLKAELEIAYKSYEGAKKTKKNLQKVIKISEDVRDSMNDQLLIGRAKLQDVLSAEVSLAKNKILLINTDAEIITNSYRIKYLSKGLFPGVSWQN